MSPDFGQPAKSQPGTVSGQYRVALVCMPFASALMPSIQIGLLCAIADRAGFPATALHFNLDLSARIGHDRYEELCGHRGSMTGEFLFADAAFGAAAPRDEAAYLAAFPDEAAWLAGRAELDLAGLQMLRRKVLPRFIADCLDAVAWSEFAVVGFSSTFQQNVASLALARLIKRRFPAVRIVFGGANMEAGMGTEVARAFPFIDHVVVGEADAVFPELLARIRDGDRRPLRGVVPAGQSAPVSDLDALPVPDYAAFFARAEALLVPTLRRLPFEGSRGCWWGAKHHCTFCGLNGAGMVFRAKSPARLLAELETLSTRHRLHCFDATDNILDPGYIEAVFAPLAEAQTDFEFFYEVKANLKRAQICRLREGGVRRIQPGIESLSSHVLKLMRKGATMLQNVRLLKWCRHYGIRVNWNLLCGFPGERARDYEDTVAVIGAIRHLEPPSGLSRIWLERFSPYFTQTGAFPIRNIRPEASYGFVYPEDVRLEEIAYFFDYDMDDTAIGPALFAVEDAVRAWRTGWDREAPGGLTMTRLPDGVIIEDSRGPRLVRYDFDGALGLLYARCGDTAQSVRQLTAWLAEQTEHASPETEVRGALETFRQSGLMVAEEDSYLAVALPRIPGR
jgi:ribosomal peptide maturation radical SAM protein 1